MPNKIGMLSSLYCFSEYPECILKRVPMMRSNSKEFTNSKTNFFPLKIFDGARLETTIHSVVALLFSVLFVNKSA